MEKLGMTKPKPHRCIICNEPLNHFAAYIPGEGEACLKCYIEYAKSTEVLPMTPPEKMEK